MPEPTTAEGDTSRVTDAAGTGTRAAPRIGAELARAAALVRARRHSRLVRRLRWILPTLSLVLVVSFWASAFLGTLLRGTGIGLRRHRPRRAGRRRAGHGRARYQRHDQRPPLRGDGDTRRPGRHAPRTRSASRARRPCSTGRRGGSTSPPATRSTGSRPRRSRSTAASTCAPCAARRRGWRMPRSTSPPAVSSRRRRSRSTDRRAASRRSASRSTIRAPACSSPAGSARASRRAAGAGRRGGRCRLASGRPRADGAGLDLARRAGADHLIPDGRLT